MDNNLSHGQLLKKIIAESGKSTAEIAAKAQRGDDLTNAEAITLRKVLKRYAANLRRRLKAGAITPKFALKKAHGQQPAD